MEQSFRKITGNLVHNRMVSQSPMRFRLPNQRPTHGNLNRFNTIKVDFCKKHVGTEAFECLQAKHQLQSRAIRAADHGAEEASKACCE